MYVQLDLFLSCASGTLDKVALWREGDFTDSGSSRVQQDKVDLKFDLARLELKLQKVHFAVKFFEAEAQPRLRRT